MNLVNRKNCGMFFMVHVHTLQLLRCPACLFYQSAHIGLLEQITMLSWPIYNNVQEHRKIKTCGNYPYLDTRHRYIRTYIFPNQPSKAAVFTGPTLAVLCSCLGPSNPEVTLTFPSMCPGQCKAPAVVKAAGWATAREDHVGRQKSKEGLWLASH